MLDDGDDLCTCCSNFDLGEKSCPRQLAYWEHLLNLRNRLVALNREHALKSWLKSRVAVWHALLQTYRVGKSAAKQQEVIVLWMDLCIPYGIGTNSSLVRCSMICWWRQHKKQVASFRVFGTPACPPTSSILPPCVLPCWNHPGWLHLCNPWWRTGRWHKVSKSLWRLRDGHTLLWRRFAGRLRSDHHSSWPRSRNQYHLP